MFQFKFLIETMLIIFIDRVCILLFHDPRDIIGADHS